MDNAKKTSKNKSLKRGIQTLREHDQESWVLFDLVKAYDTVNREMLWKILTTLGYQKAIEVLKAVHGCYDQPQSW
jgi:phage pi2 protein 07